MPSPIPPTARSAAAAPALPDGIEVFRAGVREDTLGTVHTITAADLAAAAAAYDPAVHEAPIVVGHPKHNAPAYGWISGLQAAGDSLTSSHRQVDAAFAEMVRTGRFKKRSVSFYQPTDPANPKPGVWYPRHVAYLGAQPPAVKGLREIEFSEGDADSAVDFSEPIVTTTEEPDDMSKDLQDKLDAATAQLQAEKDARAKAEADASAAQKKADAAQAQAASFAERARADRKAGYVSFAEAQVQAGRLLPKDKDMAVASLEALADTAPAEFAEGDTTRKVSHVQWLQDLIANVPATVDFAERGGGALPAASAKGKTDAEIDRTAREHAARHKTTYAEALKAVTA